MILDTNALSDLLLNNPAVVAILGKATRACLPVIVLGEYRYGLGRSRKARELLEKVDECESRFEILSIDALTARDYAAIRSELKVAGTPIPENDVWIAALSRQHGLTLLSRDAHFEHVRGLRIITW